jgi:hypothetical protein
VGEKKTSEGGEQERRGRGREETVGAARGLAGSGYNKGPTPRRARRGGTRHAARLPRRAPPTAYQRFCSRAGSDFGQVSQETIAKNS